MPPPITTGTTQSPGAANTILSSIPLVGGVVSGALQMFQNSANKKWQEKMYKRQRVDALSDWNMQNEYNSPASQMARLKAAGLNPNLVYGNGSAVSAAGSPRQSSPGSYHGEAPKLDVGSLMATGADLQIKKAQLDNLRTQNAYLVSQINKNTAQTANTIQNTAKSNFELDLARYLRETTILTHQENLKRLGVLNELGVSQTGLNLLSLDLKKQMGNDMVGLMHQNYLNAQQLNTLRDAANKRAESQNLADLKIKAQQVMNMMASESKTLAETGRIYKISRGISTANSIAELDLWLKQAGFDWKDPFVLRQLRMADRGYSR